MMSPSVGTDFSWQRPADRLLTNKTGGSRFYRKPGLLLVGRDEALS